MSSTTDGYQRDYSGSDNDERDFPASPSTTGLVESGWVDFGRINQSGDVDWFKVNLTAGVYYKFQIEASSTNGLFDWLCSRNLWLSMISDGQGQPLSGFQSSS